MTIYCYNIPSERFKFTFYRINIHNTFYIPIYLKSIKIYKSS